MIKWLAQILGGGIAQQIREAYQAKLAAQNDADRLAAEIEIARLEHRLATSDNIGLRVAIGIIALSMAGHLALVVFVSAFPQIGWTVHALPAPMDEWQAQIVMAMFGLSLAQRVVRR